ncbi:MAG: hypothetical protein ACOX18_09670 [Bacillota bacterium]
MSHRRRALLVALLFLLFAGCGRQHQLSDLPHLMQQSLLDVETYQISFSLQQGGKPLAGVTQWYRAPGLLRTDVSVADQLHCRFFQSSGRLQVHNLALDQWGVVTWSPESRLFTQPLLQSFWQTADQATWTVGQNEGCWVGEFEWDGYPAWLTLNKSDLHPLQLEIQLPGAQVLLLTFESVVINPPLDDAFFQP